VVTLVMAFSQVAAAETSAPAYDISFDGYCDGMHLNIPSLGLGTPDTVDGQHTGCITGGLFGTKSTSPNAAHITTPYGGAANPPFHFVVNANHTWTIYQDSGGGVIYTVNSGTWSFGPPRGTGSPSGAGGSVAAASTARPAYDISFDGYCDGMHLNIPSVGLGTPNTVDGQHIGCISGGLIGSKTTAPNAAHITTNYQDFWPQGIQFLVNANHTWRVYYDAGGGTIGLLNSGTWSFGPPRPGAARAAAG
jgi:hypothetical protein